MKPTTGTVVSLLLLVACSQETQTPMSPDCCAEKLPLDSISGASLYNLESTWRDQDGRERKISDIRGKVQVVAMMFTHCDYACPRILADLKAIESQLEPNAQVGFLLASFDTERDQPKTLKAYAQTRGLSPRRWGLLHGSAPAVRELAATLGVKYKRMPSGAFSHSNLITVLDPGGEIIHRQEGLGADPLPALEAIRMQLAEDR